MKDESSTEPAGAKAPGFARRWKFQGKLHLNALLHFFVIAVLLAALNWLFARSDPGWLNLNPSPWILLSFYLGFRFGISWGIGSGLLVVLFRIWMSKLHPEPDSLWPAITGGQTYLLWGVVLAGGAGGFFRAMIRRNEYRQDLRLNDSLSLNKKLKNQIALLKHNEQDLSAALVAQNLETSGFVLGLRDVIDQHAENERDAAFLSLLRDLCGVRSAALYFSARGGRGIRVAQLKSDGAFPESIDKTPMMEQAEETGKIVTQRWFWEPYEPRASGGYDDYFLAVTAHASRRDFRVLIISRMDFEQIHWENFWKIESAFHWYESARASESGGSAVPPLETVSAEPQPQSLPDPEGSSEPAPQPEPVSVAASDAAGAAASSLPASGEAPLGQQPHHQVESPAATAKPILDAPGFKVRLGQCRQIEEQMGLEHRLVVFVPGEGESQERCNAFAESLSVTMSPSDDLARIPAEGGRFVYGLLTAAPTSEAAEQHAGNLLQDLPDLDLRFFVLRLNDEALSAFVN